MKDRQRPPNPRPLAEILSYHPLQARHLNGGIDCGVSD